MSYWQDVAYDALHGRKKKPGLSAALKAKDAEFSELYERAAKAGRRAGLECRPVPMVVGEAKALVGPGSNEIDYSKPIEVVDDGACGFAWVSIHPGNCEFARWLKAKGLASPHYPAGVCIWISDWRQSVERKDAHASAMAKALQAAGLKAYAGSRLD